MNPVFFKNPHLIPTARAPISARAVMPPRLVKKPPARVLPVMHVPLKNALPKDVSVPVFAPPASATGAASAPTQAAPAGLGFSTAQGQAQLPSVSESDAGFPDPSPEAEHASAPSTKSSSSGMSVEKIAVVVMALTAVAGLAYELTKKKAKRS